MNSFHKGFALVAGLLVALVAGSAQAQADTAAAKAEKPAASTGNAPTLGAGGECISPQATQTINTCPAGPSMEGKTGKAISAAFHSAPPPAGSEEERTADEAPANPVDFANAQRDERRSRLAARVRALLVTEIQGLESLYASTPKNSPDRAQLVRRLAEDYVELESAAFRDKTEAGIKLDEAKKTNPAGAAKLQQTQTQAAAIMVAARKKAIDYYTALINDYPNYAQMDEVLYYLAYEYEQGERLRQRAQGLLRAHPEGAATRSTSRTRTSRSASSSSTRRRAIPSKWDLAAQAYTEVIKYPPPNNKVYGYAWYKLAYVYWNKGELDKALNAFKKTIEFGVAQRAAAGSCEARRQRAPRRHPGLRAQGRSRRSGVQLLQEPLGRRAGRERQDVQDDGRPREQLPRHRSLPGGDRPLPRPHGSRQGRQLLPLPGPRHPGDDGHEVRQQGPDQDRARSARSRSTTRSPRPSTPTRPRGPAPT